MKWEIILLLQLRVPVKNLAATKGDIPRIKTVSKQGENHPKEENIWWEQGKLPAVGATHNLKKKKKKTKKLSAKSMSSLIGLKGSWDG